MAHSATARRQHSYLVEQTPPEVRLTIFRMVFCTEHGIVRRADHTPKRANQTYPIIKTSLFRVNRVIGQEARDALFEENTVCWTDSIAVEYGSGNLRSVQIAGKLAQSACNGRWDVGKNIKALAQLPKLQSITLECDSFKHFFSTSVRDFASRAIVGSSTRCLAIGVFEVTPPYPSTTNVNFSHHKTALSEARELASQNSLADMEAMRWFCSGPIDVSTTLPHAQWLKYYELQRIDLLTSVDLNANIELRNLTAYLTMKAKDRQRFSAPAPSIRARFPQDVNLQDLTVEEHGVELVEWASDLIRGRFNQETEAVVRKSRGF